MTADAASAAFELDVSDWLSVAAIILSLATFVYTTLLRRSSLIVRLNISPRSFDIDLGGNMRTYSGGEAPEQTSRYRVNFEVVAFMDGNASMYLDSCIIQPKQLADYQDKLKFWRRCEFKTQLAANSVTSHNVKISSEILTQCPMLISDPNNETQQELIFSAVIYTSDGYPDEIQIPVSLTLNTQGAVIKVDAKPAKLKYHSLQVIRWAKRKITRK